METEEWKSNLEESRFEVKSVKSVRAAYWVKLAHEHTQTVKSPGNNHR